MLRLITLAVLGLLVWMSWKPEASSAGQLTDVTAASSRAADEATLDLVVFTNGNAPDQGAFDGVRLFILPFEMTTVSPPDVEVCLVQEQATYCTAGQGDTCPDMERCEITGLSYDPAVPLGVVIYDYDGWGQDGIDGFADGVRGLGAIGALVTDLNPFPEVAEQAEAARSAIATATDTTAGAIASANTHRSEWMESVILVPAGWSGETETLAELMRAQVRQDGLPEMIASSTRRLAGRIRVMPIEDCTIEGLCALTYTSIIVNLTQGEFDVQDQ